LRGLRDALRGLLDEGLINEARYPALRALADVDGIVQKEGSSADVFANTSPPVALLTSSSVLDGSKTSP
jgi:hypothetical protein